MSCFYNGDCVEGMKKMPDKYFDLAIVDPPYGGAGTDIERTGGKWAEKYGKKIKTWDIAPDKDYFDELFRVSKNQIIWGGITSTNFYQAIGILSFGKN